jgi:hypothetical protein
MKIGSATISIAEVAQCIMNLAGSYPGADLRLQVDGDGWELHFGDASYDQDHNGVWGASSLPEGKTTARECRSIARDLLNQCADQYAESGL